MPCRRRLMFLILWIALPMTLAAQTKLTEQPIIRPEFGLHPADTINISLLDSDAAKRRLKADTTKIFYKRLKSPELFFGSAMSVTADTVQGRDWLAHLSLEDFYSERAGFYLYDKGSFGQTNNLLVHGLGIQHQTLFMDDVLLNSPVSFIADYNTVSAESFSVMTLLDGYEASKNFSLPASFELHTESFYAPKSYSRIFYQQFQAGQLKTDVTFSQNLSPKLNMYLAYDRESIDGTYQDVVTDGYAAAYEANKIRIMFRYELSSKSVLTFSDFFINTKVRPFGGTDLSHTISSGGDILDPVTSFLNNYATVRLKNYNVIKADYAFYPIPRDTASRLTAWLYTTSYNDQISKSDSTVSGSSFYAGETHARRVALGGNQAVRLRLYKGYEADFNFRASLLTDNITQQNTLRTESGDYILPVQRFINFSSAAKFLLLDTALVGSATLGYQIKTLSGTNGYDYTRAFLHGGFGGEYDFKLKSFELKAFGTFSNTSRLGSLQEVFSADSSLLGSYNSKALENITEIRFGGKLKVSSPAAFAALSLAYTDNMVSNPIAPVKKQTADGTTFVQFESLQGEQLLYRALEVTADAGWNDFTAKLNATLLLDYSLLKNPDVAYTQGITALPDSTPRSTSRITYLPKLYLSSELYYRKVMLNGKLDLKVGVSGYFFTPMSASLQTSERQEVTYFNLQQTGSGLVDNNLQYGTTSYGGSVALRAWARIGGDAVISVAWENLAGATYVKTPFFIMPSRAIRVGVSWVILN
jgi:hypothetical protein